MEKFQENLMESVKRLQIADHMAYVTFPLVREQRLIIKIFDEIYKSIIYCINAILNYEYLHKRINLYQDNQENMQIFMNKCAKNYLLTNEQIKLIQEIIELNQKHRKSAMEFVRNNNVIILSDNLKTQILDIKIVKKYLLLAKELLMKTNARMHI